MDVVHKGIAVRTFEPRMLFPVHVVAPAEPQQSPLGGSLSKPFARITKKSFHCSLCLVNRNRPPPHSSLSRINSRQFVTKCVIVLCLDMLNHARLSTMSMPFACIQLR
jgi:hypothetical protein